MKTCTKCGFTFSLEMFYLDKRRSDGRGSWCRSCCKVYQSPKSRSWYWEHREEASAKRKSRNIRCGTEREKSRRRVYRYGLDEIAYAALIATGCAICGTMENLHVDHDHNCCPGWKTCGKCVRGALCARHNKAEGFLNGYAEAIALASYLLQFENVIGKTITA